MGIALPAFCAFSPKKVQIGLTASTVIIMVILIICFATYGWIVDYSSLKCDYSLSKFKCSGGFSGKLESKAKKEGETMAGLGATAFIFLFINLCILVVLLLNKFATFQKQMLIAAMASTGLVWLFLTAGWGRYADSKGGNDGSVDFGASFAFTVIMWLCLFPYAFFWFWLFNAGNDETSDQAQADGTPDNNQYNAEAGAPSYTSYTANNAGATSTDKEEAPAPAGTEQSQPPQPPTTGGEEVQETRA